MGIKFNIEAINFINVFSKVTRTNVKDCIIEDDLLIFIVGQKQAAKAIGSKGDNVKRLNNLLKKRIRIIEYNEDPVKFVGNLIYPMKAKEILREDEIVIIRANNIKEKGQIYGRERSNLKLIQSIFSKFFSGLEIKLE